MTIPSDIFFNMKELAVRHDCIFIPARLVQGYFSKYCVAFSWLTGVESYPLWIFGSATLLRYRGRYIMACTRHQLKTVEDPESVCLILPSDERSQCFTSGGFIAFDARMNDDDRRDIALFDFTKSAIEQPDLRRFFLDFRDQHRDARRNHVVGAVSYGYPFDRLKIAEHGGDLEMGKEQVVCQYVGQGSDDSVHIFKPISPLTFDPNGMSGGPAFTILKENEGFTIHFAGINVRAGREHVRVIKAGAIQMMMNTLIHAFPRRDIDDFHN